MKLLVWFVVFFLAVVACKSAKPHLSDSSPPADTLAMMQKTACFGTCPVYTVTIFINGQALYKGEQYVERVGEYQAQLSQKELASIRQLFTESNFFGFKNQYIDNFTDLPTTYLYFAQEGKRKHVEDYFGAPKDLRELEKKFSTLIESYEWRKLKSKAKE